MTACLKLAALVAASACAEFCATLSAGAEEISAQCAKLRPYSDDAYLCMARKSVTFNSTDINAAHSLWIKVPASACADASFVVYRTQPALRAAAGVGIAYTYRLRPGQSQTIAIGQGYQPGENRIQISAITYRGDCSGRAAMSWRATVMIAPKIS